MQRGHERSAKIGRVRPGSASARRFSNITLYLVPTYSLASRVGAAGQMRVAHRFFACRSRERLVCAEERSSANEPSTCRRGGGARPGVERSRVETPEFRERETTLTREAALALEYRQRFAPVLDPRARAVAPCLLRTSRDPITLRLLWAESGSGRRSATRTRHGRNRFGARRMRALGTFESVGIVRRGETGPKAS